MGRQTSILKTDIHHESEDSFKIDPAFIKMLEKKYKIQYSWKFDEDGEVVYKGNDVYGEIEDHILALFEIAKEYNCEISGTFVYSDDQTGAAYEGIVYLASDQTARIYEFNVDINIKTLKDVKSPLTIKEIKL